LSWRKRAAEVSLEEDILRGEGWSLDRNGDQDRRAAVRRQIDLISYHQTEKEETINELTGDFYL
jgi:hypothetical protein